MLKSKGFDVHSSTPQRWAERGSIPGEYWKVLSDEDVASLEELATSADRRREAVGTSDVRDGDRLHAEPSAGETTAANSGKAGISAGEVSHG
ncbi:MAG: hypothetical protein V4618_00710 [Pseudomonadota bacterium]